MDPATISFETDEMDEMEELGFFEGGQLPDLCPNLENEMEEGEIAVRENAAPCQFYNEALLQSLQNSQFSPEPSLTYQWLNGEDFLSKRWGLCLAGVQDYNANERVCMRLGLPSGPVDIAITNLFEHIVAMGSLAPTTDWDLDSARPTVFGSSTDNPYGSLSIQSIGEEYLLTIVGRPWKVLIKDALTMLQIKREEWHVNSEHLVSNLIQNGLPFQLLYPACQTDIPFHSNPGPVIHPEGKCPTRDDYLVYRLDVARFLMHNPHAHVAALCTGGILWRIAVDVLPIPTERRLAGPFHPDACYSVFLFGQQYWSPALSLEDEETIVGVYKWPGKSDSEYQGA